MQLNKMLVILTLVIISFVLFSGGCIEEENEKTYTITYVNWDDRYGPIFKTTICAKKDHMVIEEKISPPGGVGGGIRRHYAIPEGYYRCTWLGMEWDPCNTLEYQAVRGGEKGEWKCEVLEDYIRPMRLWQEWELVKNNSEFKYNGTRIIEGIDIEAECFVSHNCIECFHPDTHILLLGEYRHGSHPSTRTFVTYINMEAPKDSVFELPEKSKMQEPIISLKISGWETALSEDGTQKTKLPDYKYAYPHPIPDIFNYAKPPKKSPWTPAPDPETIGYISSEGNVPAGGWYAFFRYFRTKLYVPDTCPDSKIVIEIECVDDIAKITINDYVFYTNGRPGGYSYRKDITKAIKFGEWNDVSIILADTYSGMAILKDANFSIKQGWQIPGFEATFAIAGLSTVVYLLRRRK